MTQKVEDKKIATFARQQHDWMERVLKNSLDPVEVAQAVYSIIGRGKMFAPHTYFTTREGMWVSSRFANRILAKQTTTMPYRGLEGVASVILARNMTDQEIIAELLGGMEEVRKHPFTLDQVAAMIDLQPNGKDGELLKNGYANIFYVLVDEVLFAVRAYWSSGYCEWRVDAWHLDGHGNWRAGNRVFRNTTLEV